MKALRAIVRNCKYLFPLLALCLTVVVENMFDRLFVSEYPRDLEHHVLCASTVGLIGSPGAPGPFLAASVVFPGRMITGSAESVVGWFKWAHPSRDSAAATRELTSRFIIEIADLAVIVVAVLTILKCIGRVHKLWCDVDWLHVLSLVGLTFVTAFVTYVLWFSSLQPFEHTLPNALTAHAIAITDREGLALVAMGIQYLVIIVAIPLVAMTSGFIIAKGVAESTAREQQLNDLTTLLFLTAALVVLFMFMLCADLLWVGSLLAQGKDSEGALVQQLALAMSMNFGVFFACLLAALHIPSVWAVTSEPCIDQLGTRATSPTQYYVRLGTILSPLLAGIPLTKLVSFVFG